MLNNDLTRRLVYRVRRTAYRMGARPQPGSILYSPSLSLIYAMADAMPALKEALDGKK